MSSSRDQIILTGTPGTCLAIEHRLAHVVLGAAAPAEAAAEVHLVDLALGERQSRRLGRRGKRALAVLRRRPTPRTARRVYFAVQFIGSMQAWLRNGVA